MVFLHNSDDSAPYFDSVVFRNDTFWTFSFVLKNCPEATVELPFVGYIPVGSPAVLYPLYVLRSWDHALYWSAYLRTPLVHYAAYEQGPDLDVPIYMLESQPYILGLLVVGQKIGHDGNQYNLYGFTILDSEDTVVSLALYPAGYQPLPLVSDLTCDLTQAPFIPLNLAMIERRSVSDSRVRSPTINRLRFDPIALASRAHSSVADSSESGLLESGSIVSSSIVETSYKNSSARPARGGKDKAKKSEPANKGTLKFIMANYPNWGKALAHLRCLLRVAVCRGDCSSLFLLVMADFQTERAAVIQSIWPETLNLCDLQLNDLERDNDTLSDADILALGDAWFSLFMYDNKRQASASIVTTRAGFDLTQIFGVALHDKIMSIILRLTPPQSDCLPLADNGLVWFLSHQITKELAYHIVFRPNATPHHRISVADLDPASFRQAAHPPVATLSLIITSCYDVLLDYFSNEFKDSNGFIHPSEMHTHICETLPMLFGQSDDPSYATFMTAMNALCNIKKGDVQRVTQPMRGTKRDKVA
ncbi:hypothetical protein EDD22DRAFT_959141 [Suillus occidentalis]|nr:hypothetical protein EDD22DRAFT_959141 [Suillus occidentalis]